MALIPIENKRGGVAQAQPLILYYNGSGNDNWENGVYQSASACVLDGGFTFNSGNMTCANVSTKNHSRTIVSTKSIDFTKYCKLCAIYNGSTTITVDLTSVNGSGYVCLNGIYSDDGTKRLQVVATRQKANFASYGIRYILAEATVSMPFSISKVWLEPYPTFNGVLYDAGGNVPFELNQHTISSSYTLYGTVSMTSGYISMPLLTSLDGKSATITTKNKIKLSNYSTLHVLGYNVNSATKQLDLSLSNITDGYVNVYIYRYNDNTYFGLSVSSEKDNFDSHRLAYTTQGFATTKVTKIWLT